MKTTKNNKYKDTLYLAAGEAVVALIITLVYLAIGRFSYTVVSGAILGGAVATLNFFLLSRSMDKVIAQYIDERGSGEMTEEEAEKFSSDHKIAVQNSMTRSYIVRNVLMIVILVAALITRQFDPLALLLPLVMYKPLIYVTEFIKKKRGE